MGLLEVWAILVGLNCFKEMENHQNQTLTKQGFYFQWKLSFVPVATMSILYVSFYKKSSFIYQTFSGIACFAYQHRERKDKVFAISLPLRVPKAQWHLREPGMASLRSQSNLCH